MVYLGWRPKGKAFELAKGPIEPYVLTKQVNYHRETYYQAVHRTNWSEVPHAINQAQIDVE